MKIDTVMIIQGDQEVLINESDYDPDVHKLAVEPKKVPAKKAAAKKESAKKE